MRGRRRPPNGLYELLVFARNSGRKKPAWVRVKSLCDYYNSAFDVALAVWRYTHVPQPYKCVVIDRAAGKGTLAPTVSYEELLRRSGSAPVKGVQA